MTREVTVYMYDNGSNGFFSILDDYKMPLLASTKVKLIEGEFAHETL